MSENQSINVAIRMRPLNRRESEEGQEERFQSVADANTVVQVNEEGEVISGQTYTYDHVFDSDKTTADVYDSMAKDLVDSVVSGINGTIFAYGQTSSGKTFTMLGAEGDNKGILELAAEAIFDKIAQTEGRDFLLRVSFVEIYNEVIRDLLADAKHGQNEVAIREDPRRGVYCEASETIITDFASIMGALRKGISKRSVEATAMNDTSSRSHTIFKLVVESKARPMEGQNPADGAVLVAALNLVDLAGSESVRHTGATGQRQKEGGKINQSLLSLSRVICALSTPGMHVSYRDSKLTRLLQPSLSGNAKMSVVCCITPAEKYLEETRSTLQFAQRASMVKTSATVNEVLDDSAKIKRLEREIRKLRDKNDPAPAEMGVTDTEKEELLKRVTELQSEREKATAKINRLKELVVSGGASIVSAPMLDADASFDMAALRKPSTTRNRKRDTWCPGFSGASTSTGDNNCMDHSMSGDLSADSANSASTVVLEAQVNHQRGKLEELRAALKTAETKLAEMQAKSTETEELHSRLDEAEEIATFKEQELAALTDEVTRTNQLLGAAEAEKDDLMQQLQDAAAANKRYKMHADAAQEALKRSAVAEKSGRFVEHELKEQQEAQALHTFSLMQQLAQARGDAAAAADQLEVLRAKSSADATMEHALAESEEESERAQLLVFTLSQQLRAAEATVNQQKAAIRAAQAAHMVEICGAKEEAERHEASALASYTLAQQVRVLEADLAQKAATMAALESAREGEVNYLNPHPIPNLDLNPNSNPNQQVDDMAEQLVALNDRLDVLLTEKKALEDEASQMDEMITALEESNATASSREKELSDLLENVQCEREEARNAQAQLQAELEGALDAQVQGDEDREQMKGMETEMADLRAQVAAAQADKAELLDRVEMAEASLADREEALNEAHTLLTETEDALAVEKEKASCAASSEETDALKAQVAELTKSLSSARTQTSDAQEAAQELQERYTALLEVNTNLQAQVSAADKTAAELNTVLSANRDQRVVLEDRCESLQRRLEEAEDQLAELPTMPLEGMDQLLKAGTAADQPDAALIEEMNQLMEQKMAAEGRAAEAEAKARSYREQLSEHDKAAAREQEEFCEAAEAEMASLRAAMDEKDRALQEKEDALAAVENELFAVQQSASASALATIPTGLSAAGDVPTGDVAQDANIVELRKLIAEKDKRIAHLETTKLTKEQMQKIKTVKEERSKFYAECKTLKKNLRDLKKAYDELAASPAALLTSAPVPAETMARVTEATNRLAEVRTQLAATKEALAARDSVVESLKDKLKDCGRQLHEYEVERRGVVEALGEAGVDTTGLLLCDASIDESLGSIDAGEVRDLCDAVKLLAAQRQEAAAATSVQASSLSAVSGKVAETEASIVKLSSELTQAGSRGVKLERENLKLSDALEQAQQQLDTLTREREMGEARIAALEREVALAEAEQHKRASAGDEDPQSEIIALEEENLELMKENKTLRQQLAGFKSGKGGDVKTASVMQENVAQNSAEAAKLAGKQSPFASGVTEDEQAPECNQS